MKIKVGDYDVLRSGTVIGNIGEPIDFEIGKGGITSLRVNFLNKTPDDKYVFAEVHNETGVQMNFLNIENPLGSGNVIPLDLGTYDNRKLFFNYRIYPLKDSGHQFHYTFLLGKEVKIGK